MGDQPVVRLVSTRRTAQTQDKRKQRDMSRVGFEPTIPVLEWTKTSHALHRGAIVIGLH
jgi:hypothetical protein